MSEKIRNWQTLSVRVSTFHKNLRSDLKQDAITPTFGVEVESVEVKPGELRRVEVAALGPGRLIFNSAVNRVDWIWQSIEEKEPPHIALGAPSGAVATFAERVETWVSGQDDIVRLAVGGVFGIPVSTKEESYEVLNQLIPELQLDPSSSELLYQINRPASVRANDDDITLNVIEKWSCRRLSRTDFSFAFGPDGAAPFPSNSNEALDISIHAVCELDINTSLINSQPFDAKSRQELLIGLADRVVSFLQDR